MSTVLVLNKNMEYWTEVGLHKALKWIMKNKVEVIVEKEDEEIRGVRICIKVPVIVKLVNFIGYKIKKETVEYSDDAVYDRDRNQCQYWHYTAEGKRYIHQCTELDRTIDHINPKSKGGRKSFLNSVCACKNCNINIKKNRLPEEAGLELIRKPFIPPSRRGEMMIIRFTYNPNKFTHRIYREKILGLQ